ncbi:hypothetical protein GE09DRAFT_1215920 [Coniochaeta sp. 2T2.1]|nr:hypothetical protein GE09DRAFT_1215920 [Coniochaeta sp. 2T2.1]
MSDVDAPANPQLQDAYRLIQEHNRLAKEKTRRLLQNRPQSWRHILGLICGTHFAVLIGRLGADLMFKGLRFNRLNILSAVAFVIAVTTRVIWQVLFVNPYVFLGYRRPSAAYRMAVYIVSFATTVPTLVLHAVIVHTAAQDTSPLRVDLGQSIVQFALQLAAIILYAWMARRFLLQHNDEHYEPTRQPSLEPIPQRPATGHLAKAFARQLASRDEITEHVQETQVGQSTDGGTANASTPLSPGCPTIARFDYLPQSKLFDPLIPLILGICSTVVAYWVYQLVKENNLSKFRLPTAKYGLYAPLGVYLICVLATKRITHVSSFARLETTTPQPWTRVSTLFGRSLYRNSEDGSTTTADPRRRVPLDASDYIAKYNNIGATCDQYWGHRGREWITDFRLKSVSARFMLLSAASYFFVKGMLTIFNYPLHADELGRPDLTRPDLERQMRIMSLKVKLMISTAPLSIFMLFYSLFSGVKLFNLWTEAVIKYAPAERQPEGRI